MYSVYIILVSFNLLIVTFGMALDFGIGNLHRLMMANHGLDRYKPISKLENEPLEMDTATPDFGEDVSGYDSMTEAEYYGVDDIDTGSSFETAVNDMNQAGENTDMLIDSVVNPMSNQAFTSPVFEDQVSEELLGPGMFQPDTTIQDNLVSEQFQNRDIMEKMSQMPVDRMYNALMQAEHRGAIDREGYDPFIRTKATGTGSSAYGPVQMTSGRGSMVMRALEDPALAKEIGLTEDDLAYAQEFASQGANFLKYGGGDWKKYGDEGLAAKDLYEYGKAGTLTSDENRAAYENLAKKFIAFEMKRATDKGGTFDANKFIQSWRGRTEAQDKDYYDVVRNFY